MKKIILTLALTSAITFTCNDTNHFVQDMIKVESREIIDKSAKIHKKAVSLEELEKLEDEKLENMTDEDILDDFIRTKDYYEIAACVLGILSDQKYERYSIKELCSIFWEAINSLKNDGNTESIPYLISEYRLMFPKS